VGEGHRDRAAAPAAVVIVGAADQSNLGDRIAAMGTWEAESMNEVIEILRGGRDENRKLPNLL
jgi:hypothetical protein